MHQNPAQTGNANKSNRLTFLYRDQWRSVPVPYVSSYFSYDRRIIQKNNNRLGGGINFFYDKTGDGNLNTFNPNINVSYTRLFNMERHGFSFGTQIGYLQRKINTANLQFDNQYNGIGFDPALSSGETINATSNSLTLSTGINYMTKMGRKSIWNIGFSIHNPHKPDLSLSEFTEDKRPIRYHSYLEAELFVKNEWSFSPSLNFQFQEAARELFFAGIAHYYSEKGTIPIRWSFGGGYRVDDAALIYIGSRFNDLQVGLSYDINTSSFSNATDYRGGFEISLNYEFEKKKDKEVEPFELVRDSIQEIEEEEEKIKEEEVIKAEEPTIEETKSPIDSSKIDKKPVIEPIEQEITIIESKIPVKLFFENDEPNPKTLDPTTKTTYEQAYKSYINNQILYETQLGKTTSDNWFYNVEKGWQDLSIVIENIVTLLDKGRKISITLKGYTSPLAPSQYNNLLSMRRIESIVNFMMEYKNGILLEYFNNNNLVIAKNPFGESLSPLDVGDSASDKKSSIYDPKAAYERRIEMIAIELID